MFLFFMLLLSLFTSIEAQERLKVAAGFITPPLEFTRSRKQVGMEVDLIKEIAQHLDYEVEFMYGSPQQAMQWLKEKKCDMVMGEFAVTQQVEGLCYTDPFLESSITVLTDKRLRPHLLSFSDLATAKVGVLKGSIEAQFVQDLHQQGKVGQVVYYPAERTLDALADLTTSQIDAFIRLSVITLYLKYAAANLHIAFSLPIPKQKVGFLVACDQVELREKINQAQQQLQEKGIYQNIMHKWFVSPDFNIDLAKLSIDGVDH